MRINITGAIDDGALSMIVSRQNTFCMESLYKLKAELDEYCGLFLDGWAAFQVYKDRMAEGFQAGTPSNGVVALRQTSAATSYLSAGPPLDCGKAESSEVELHSAETADLISRNADNGKNHIFFRRMVLVGFYHRWDEYHRHQIAESFGVDFRKVIGDVFGDIRLIRNSIIHGKGVAQPDIAKAVILKWFNPGDEIDVDIDKFFNLKVQVDLWISTILVNGLAGLDPLR